MTCPRPLCRRERFLISGRRPLMGGPEMELLRTRDHGAVSILLALALP